MRMCSLTDWLLLPGKKEPKASIKCVECVNLCVHVHVRMCVCILAYIYMCVHVCMCVNFYVCVCVCACVLVCVACRIHFKQLLYNPNAHTGAVECAWTVMEEKAMQLLFSGFVSRRSPRTGTSHSPISKKMDDFFFFFFFDQFLFSCFCNF